MLRGPDAARRSLPAACRALARAAALAVALAAAGAACAQEPPVPSFAELEAAGARIGTIRVVTRDIFDTDDPKENYRLFRWANALHIQTRPGVVERALLFHSGEPLSVRALEETERLLRSNRYLNDVKIRAAAYHDGVVDIEVITRDTWTLDPGFNASRSGGANSSGLQLKEYNLLGTGTTLGFSRSRNVDRASSEFQIANERAFGTWTSMGYSHASNSDGQRDAAAVLRPFYALDARWAAGVSASQDDRLESVYNAGNLVAEYRHRHDKGEVFGGGSAGLIDGWVRRYSLGASYEDSRYALEPGRSAPARLPADEKQVAPFVRFELIEDRYEAEENRNQMGRPEYFALGLASTLQLGWADRGLGSTRDALLYSGRVSRGFLPAPGHTLLAAASAAGQLYDGRPQRQRIGGELQYYAPQGRRWLFYASAAGDRLTRPGAGEELMLGGDNGLRGYPLRYQSGTQRALATIEERFFTDVYLWRLFRFGGAAFIDAGRAWGGDNVNTSNPGWLSDIGAGLRIVNTRAAFSTVLHIDVAVPLNATPDIKKVQFLVKTKASF